MSTKTATLEPRLVRGTHSAPESSRASRAKRTVQLDAELLQDTHHSLEPLVSRGVLGHAVLVVKGRVWRSDRRASFGTARGETEVIYTKKQTPSRWIVRHLLGNAGSLFSVEKFFAALKSQGIAISKDTVHQLVHHLEDCFLIRVVWMESKSERQRMVNPRKVYPVDPGLIPVFDRSGKSNVGHALETAVLIELQRRRNEVTYLRTPSGYEVDFLARDPEGNLELIQVCADASDPDTARRELRALEDVTDFPTATKRLLTLSTDTLPSEAPAGIVCQPAYEWLFG